jgi:fructose-1,6-bisphosphatase/sedoheptulose 1,7-bisphosphatase-like protein
LTKEQINTFKLGPQYAIKKNPKLYINELIIDTENAIRNLQSNTQNTFRYLAAKKIKQIKESNRHNTLQKRHQHNIKQIKEILQHNNLTITKADKSKHNSNNRQNRIEAKNTHVYTRKQHNEAK